MGDPTKTTLDLTQVLLALITAVVSIVTIVANRQTRKEVVRQATDTRIHSMRVQANLEEMKKYSSKPPAENDMQDTWKEIPR